MYPHMLGHYLIQSTIVLLMHGCWDLSFRSAGEHCREHHKQGNVPRGVTCRGGGNEVLQWLNGGCIFGRDDALAERGMHIWQRWYVSSYIFVLCDNIARRRVDMFGYALVIAKTFYAIDVPSCWVHGVCPCQVFDGQEILFLKTKYHL